MAQQTHLIVEKAWLAEHPLTAYGLEDWRRYDNGVWSVLSEYQIYNEIRVAAEECLKADQITGMVTNGLIESVANLAKSRVWVCTDKWDADSNLLACTNGTLDIRAKTLMPHDPKNYLTGGVPFAYDPDADAPTWCDVLSKSIPEAAEFFREFAGYALTTSTRWELAVWLYGPPGCGKSTLIGGLETMLGGRAGMLGLDELENSRFGLSQILGKTLLVSSEQPSMFMKSTHKVNSIISGEKISVERKFREALEVKSYAKILWSMNDLPRVGDAGNGLFRRVKVIRFPALAEAERDPSVKERIAQEGAGILNWALIGLERLLKRGTFDVPQSVKDATTDFQHSNDTPAVFVAECCTLDKNASTKSSELYAEYSAWCVRNGHKPQSSTSMAREWERLGLAKEKRTSGMFWVGILIKPSIP